MTDCPGGCNAWWRGLTPEQQEASHARPRPGDPYWCHRCKARIRRALTELPDIAAILDAQITGYRGQALDPGHGNGYQPSPSVTGDDLDDLDDHLIGHEMAYRAHFNRRNPDRPMLPSPPRRGVLATVTDTTTAWLCRHLDDILATDMAPHFGEEIIALHRQLAAKAHAIDTRRRGDVPCPACQLLLLYWVDGHEGLICGGCGRYVTKDEYEDDMRAARRDLERAS